MSEELRRNGPGALVVRGVVPDSAGSASGLQPGDRLVDIDGMPVRDVLDLAYWLDGSARWLGIDRDGTRLEVRLDATAGEDPGLTFEDDLADGVHTCVNKCVFCFIHQMPRKMRRTLYLMDDDYRLSFAQGNYVTLTNLAPGELDRIVEQRLSPLYVSVHATDPELRGILLGKKEPAPILPMLRTLAEGRVDAHCQIVLCPGWNDGDHLVRTLRELATLHPAATGLRAGVYSAAVVPVGLTRYRDRLRPLQSVDREYARKMIAAMRPLAREFEGAVGTRFVWLSDEWYHLSGRPVPGRSHYEDFPQLDDGVGTLRLFKDAARGVARRLPTATARPVKGTVVTAGLASPVVTALVDRLNQVEGVRLRTVTIVNRFFGERINVAGLMTGTDIAEQVSADGGEGPVYVPSICLRDGEVFVDDMTVADVEAQVGRQVVVVEPKPAALVRALDLDPVGRP